MKRLKRALRAKRRDSAYDGRDQVGFQLDVSSSTAVFLLEDSDAEDVVASGSGEGLDSDSGAGSAGASILSSVVGAGAAIGGRADGGGANMIDARGSSLDDFGRGGSGGLDESEYVRRPVQHG